jgi:type III secretion protein V
MNTAVASLPNKGFARHSDLALAALVVAVIVMMALPLPPWSLDILVACNIAIGVVILLVALFIPSPLAFSTFPSVLLITTLFRISLNVATTRQILLNAHAGDIITAFGKLVVGGSLVVGIVVFLIITIVQFIVIAKGAERVAEVGARFTLDALPGKQMSIDADVRAGMISQAEAIARRNSLIQESQFYGAMDGAMKFVKGDAIAGIVIVLVNLLGGIAIGTLVMDLSFGAAIQKFAILSIGDGLVTQIPALFLSIAAGIAITRNESGGAANLGDQIAGQLASQPRALMLGAGVMLLFAFVPGFPTLTFLGLGLTVAAISVLLMRVASNSVAAKGVTEVLGAAREGEHVPVLLQSDRVPTIAASAFRLELSEALANSIGAGRLDSALAKARLQLKEDYGLPFPGLALRVTNALGGRSLAVVVQDLTDTTITLPMGAWLAYPGNDVEAFDALQGTRDAVPELLLPGKWILADQRDAANRAQCLLLDDAAVLAHSVMLVVQKYPAAALGVQEVRQMVRDIEWRYPDLLREAQSVVPLPRLADLMAALAREQVPLTDFPGLLQALVTNAGSAADAADLYEVCRLALARNILARQRSAGQDSVAVVDLDPAFEARLRTGLVTKSDGPALALEPTAAAAAIAALREAFDTAGSASARTLLLPSDLRRATSRLFRGSLPRVRFVSQEEVAASGLRVITVGTAKLQAIVT